MGQAGLGGGAVGVINALIICRSRPWTDEGPADHDRRWKWDGSSNDDMRGHLCFAVAPRKL